MLFHLMFPASSCLELFVFMRRGQVEHDKGELLLFARYSKSYFATGFACLEGLRSLSQHCVP